MFFIKGIDFYFSFFTKESARYTIQNWTFSKLFFKQKFLLIMKWKKNFQEHLTRGEYLSQNLKLFRNMTW